MKALLTRWLSKSAADLLRAATVANKDLRAAVAILRRQVVRLGGEPDA